MGDPKKGGRPTVEPFVTVLDKLEVSAEVRDQLTDLRDRGLFGKSYPEVVRSLLGLAVADLIHKGVLNRRPPKSGEKK